MYIVAGLKSAKKGRRAVRFSGPFGLKLDESEA